MAEVQKQTEDLYMGRPLSELTREELEDAVRVLGGLYQRQLEESMNRV